MNDAFVNAGKHYASRTHEDMKPVLKNPDAPGPAVYYYVVRGGHDLRNVTIWEPGLVGDEYVKSHGHYHQDGLDETYWFTLGEGILLMQKLASGEGDKSSGRVADFKAVVIKAGESHFIPAGYGHAVANTGATLLVSVDDSSARPVQADYDSVAAWHGFAYYVVERDGKPALLRNPAYATVAQVDAGGLEIVQA